VLSVAISQPAAGAPPLAPDGATARGADSWGITDPGTGTYPTGGLALLGEWQPPALRTLRAPNTLTVDPANGDLILFEPPTYFDGVVDDSAGGITTVRLRPRSPGGAREQLLLEVVGAPRSFEAFAQVSAVAHDRQRARLFAVCSRPASGPPGITDLIVLDASDPDNSPTPTATVRLFESAAPVRWSLFVDSAGERLFVLAWDGALAVVDLSGATIDTSSVSTSTIGFTLNPTRANSLVLDPSRSLALVAADNHLTTFAVSPIDGSFTELFKTSLPFDSLRRAFAVPGVERVAVFDSTGPQQFSFGADAAPEQLDALASTTGSPYIYAYDAEGEPRFVRIEGNFASEFAIRGGFLTSLGGRSFAGGGGEPVWYDADARLVYHLSNSTANPPESFIERHLLGIDGFPVTTQIPAIFTGRAVASPLLSIKGDPAANRLYLGGNTAPASLTTLLFTEGGEPTEVVSELAWIEGVDYIRDLAVDPIAGTLWAVWGIFGQRIATFRLDGVAGEHEYLGSTVISDTTESYAPTVLELANDRSALFALRERSSADVLFDRYDLDPATHLPTGAESVAIPFMRHAVALLQPQGRDFVVAIGDMDVQGGKRSIFGIIAPNDGGAPPELLLTRASGSGEPNTWESGSAFTDPRTSELVIFVYTHPGQTVFRWDLTDRMDPVFLGGQSYSGVGGGVVFDPDSSLFFSAPYDSKWLMPPASFPTFLGGLTYRAGYEMPERSGYYDRSRGLIARAAEESVIVSSVTLQPTVQFMSVGISQFTHFDTFHWYSHSDRGLARFGIYVLKAGGGARRVWQSDPIPMTASSGFESVPIRNGWGGTIPVTGGPYWLAWKTDDWGYSIGSVDDNTVSSFHYYWQGGELPDEVETTGVGSANDWAMYVTLGDGTVVPNGVAIR
jgi:hypothetical protein